MRRITMRRQRDGKAREPRRVPSDRNRLNWQKFGVAPFEGIRKDWVSTFLTEDMLISNEMDCSATVRPVPPSGAKKMDQSAQALCVRPVFTDSFFIAGSMSWSQSRPIRNPRISVEWATAEILPIQCLLNWCTVAEAAMPHDVILLQVEFRIEWLAKDARCWRKSFGRLQNGSKYAPELRTGSPRVVTIKPMKDRSNSKAGDWRWVYRGKMPRSRPGG
jgi:hypothetical protein